MHCKIFLLHLRKIVSVLYIIISIKPYYFQKNNFLFLCPGALHRGASERGCSVQNQDPLLLPRPVQGHPHPTHREELPHLLPGTENNYHIFYQVQRRTATSFTRYREQLPHLLPGTEKKIWIL